MKKLFVLLSGISLIVLCMSCEKLFNKNDDSTELSGGQSPMGEVGATVVSGSMQIAGVSNFSAQVTALTGGVSSYSAMATVTNPVIRNMMANVPGVTITGNTISMVDMKVKQTTEGIKCESGPNPGILVNYNSSVGDTYPIGSTGQDRKVVKKAGVDDYPYGLMLIKTIQVEQIPSKLKSNSGITKITYIANHKFGLVGVQVAFDDGTNVTFPVYNSAQNK